MRDEIMELIMDLHKLPNRVVTTDFVIERLLTIIKTEDKKESK